MTFANHLHLRRRSSDAVLATLHHRFEQFPCVVALQFQQGLVDGEHNQFRVVARAVVVRACDLHLDLRLFARLIFGLVGGHRNVEAVALPVHVNVCDAEFERWLCQIHHRGGRGSTDATTHQERRHIRVRCPLLFHWHFDHGGLARKLGHKARQHRPIALHGH